MYTGIVDHLGVIKRIEKINDGIRLVISTEFNELVLGESIAVDGFCVTVTEFAEGQFSCELSPETLKLTTASEFSEGTQVNLERSLRLGDRLGGHFVMGHVDAVAEVESLDNQGDFLQVKFAGLLPSQQVYLCKKGSVSVNGVSLTINESYPHGFSVMLIPHTQQRTNLQYLRKHSKVNIEFDTIARQVVHQAQLQTPSTNV